MKKKNIEPIKIELPLEEEPLENIQQNSDVTTSVETSRIAEEKKRLESDQEKMVLELFDGKYID